MQGEMSTVWKGSESTAAHGRHPCTAGCTALFNSLVLVPRLA